MMNQKRREQNLGVSEKIVNRAYEYSDLYFHHVRIAPDIDEFNYSEFARKVLDYTESLHLEGPLYRFSQSVAGPSLYASCYACMLRGLLGEIKEDEKEEWANYFDSFQIDNGLFVDTSMKNENEYMNGDGWGARHLLPHLCIAYERIGKTPSKEFRYFDQFNSPDSMLKWLNSLDMTQIYSTSNQIMNVLVGMQYARDRMDKEYSSSISIAEEWLLQKYDTEYGLWMPERNAKKRTLENAIRGSYHIFPLFIYDGLELKASDITVKNILETQNIYGGFDSSLLSSACYDIDAIEPLIRFGDIKECRTNKALKKAFRWVLSNYNEDGGFVFQRYCPFSYGGEELLSSMPNESNLFATWFRTLSIIYILVKYGKIDDPCLCIPGYENEVKYEK